MSVWSDTIGSSRLTAALDCAQALAGPAELLDERGELVARSAAALACESCARLHRVGAPACPHVEVGGSEPVVIGLVTVGRVRVGGSPALAGAAARLVAEIATGLAKETGAHGEERRQLALAEERLEHALAATSDAIWDWDLLTNQTFYSPRWYEMLGYAPGSFPATFETWAAMTLPEDLEEATRVVSAAVAAGTGYETVFRMRHADGTLRWIRGRGRISGRSAEGVPLRISGTNTDVTERVQAEAEREKLSAALRQSDKLSALGQLAGGIAHDFNNQLTAVIGAAELLAARLQEAELRELADDILLAAGRSAGLTRKLLSFSRKGTQQRVVVDVHVVIGEVLSMLGRSIDRRIELSSNLAARSAMVVGDPAELQNALLNLALNARDAMSTGGKLRIETQLLDVSVDEGSALPGLRSGTHLQISVTDTGHGMSKEVQERLFEPFFTTKPAGRGTGMGLASVHGTIYALGGAIAVFSEPGRGSSFRLFLPLAPDGATGTSLTPLEVPRLRRLRLLLVDDEPLVREQLQRSLLSLGHEVESAGGGREALRLFEGRESPFDVVMLDVVMPDLGGLDTFRALRKLDPSQRVLVTSGFALDGEVQALLDAGATAFLPKPFLRAQLARALAAALG